MSKPLVLLIEDEEDIRELVRYNLEREGYRVREADSGEEGLVQARKHPPDLIILDLMLPGIQGLEVCRRLRSAATTRQTPLIIASAKGEEADIVSGLEMGADDYIAKPFSTRELVARVRSVLRRGRLQLGDAPDEVIRVGNVRIDSGAHEVKAGDAVLDLTPAEFRLLRALAESPGRAFTRSQLIRYVTRGQHHIVERNIDVHVRSLRRKLGTEQHIIKTVRGIGYKLDA